MTGVQTCALPILLLRVMDDLDNTTEPEDIVTTEPAETAVTTTKED